MEERMKARIEELKKDRERYVTEANKNIFAMDAAIGELNAILNPPPPDAPVPPENNVPLVEDAVTEHTNGLVEVDHTNGVAV